MISFKTICNYSQKSRSLRYSRFKSNKSSNTGLWHKNPLVNFCSSYDNGATIFLSLGLVSFRKKSFFGPSSVGQIILDLRSLLHNSFAIFQITFAKWDSEMVSFSARVHTNSLEFYCSWKSHVPAPIPFITVSIYYDRW